MGSERGFKLGSLYQSQRLSNQLGFQGTVGIAADGKTLADAPLSGKGFFRLFSEILILDT